MYMSTPRRYELAWNYIWEGYNNWKKEVITNDSDSRQGKELSKEGMMEFVNRKTIVVG